MKKYFICNLVAITLSLSVFGQSINTYENRKNSIGISFGWYRAGLLDKSFSPLLFIGNGLDISTNYTWQTTKSLNKIELQFINLPFYPQDHSIKNEFNYTSHNEAETYKAYPWKAITGNLSYEHLRKLNMDRSGMDLFIGGIINNYIQIIYPQTWILSYSLGPKGRLQYSINAKHSVSASWQFPLISMVNRPPYATWNNDVMYGSIISHFYSGKPMFLNNLFYSKLTIEYTYAFSEKFNFSAVYNNTYYKCRINRDYTSLINALNVGLSYKF
jgi:hypothetical protein